ncbi:uncharacterized protein LOC118744970 isoform X1 [Rhagoletis pomonella]|uniref:uncharacterized protein LOC118744970 isoform X1 n=1 Tax=Rhagoletis pomonella TaxID=28610 RepID=UPI00178163B5|nr:uncharacterized protein LOC118744970 isoform X1 [Rhagoletis pomonella]
MPNNWQSLKMEVSVKTQDENEARVAEEYLSSLSDLTCNSKPLINMLTMLAEENIACAPIIVKVVEQHIAKVPPDIKLPLLYLIDSIVKNVKSTYIHLFSQCIVNIFCDVFEKVNEKVRERMYALRLTWNEVFPSQKLYALDVKVKRIDNNWPITAKQAQPSIHVNPNFLKSGNVQASDVEEILQAKTRELLELKKRKLELELEATKKSLEEQDKHLTKVTNGLVMPPEAANTVVGLRMPGVPPQIMPPGVMPPGIMPPHHMHPRAPHSMMVGGPTMPPGPLFHPNFQHPRSQQPQQHMPVGMMSMPPQNFPPVSSSNKPKVHPVNPALLNTIRHRDPRLARQQQQQQETITSMRGASKSSSRAADDSHRSDSKSSSSSSSTAYRNGGGSSSSKSNRNDGSSSAGGGSGSESRHSSSSASERHRKGSSSRDKDKDKDRKRSESKSSTSSGGSSSSERQKIISSMSANVSSSRSSKKSTTSKCDKDAFEIAPLSTTFKRKSSTTSLPGSDTSSPRKKELKRKTHSTHSSPTKHRSRSRSPNEQIAGKSAASGVNSTSSLSDRDERRALPIFPPKIQLKGHATDSEHDMDVEKSSSKNAATNVENKNKSTAQQPATTVARDNDDELSTTTTASTGTIEAATAATKGASTLRKPETTAVDDEDGAGAGGGGGAVVGVDDTGVSSSASVKRHMSIDTSEQQLIKPKAPPLSPVAFEPMDVDTTGSEDKKRLSTSNVDLEEPLAKKSKSAKFDALFGDEDVDLRTGIPPQILAAQLQQKPPRSASKSPTPPPPPFITDEQHAESWNNLKTAKTTKTSSPLKKTSNLDDVRAKLAKATKYSKLNKSEKSAKDPSQRLKLSETELNDDSQDANDEKIRTIVAQAQELLETKSINQDQYKNLMQKVMSINETSKLKEAKKRESLGGNAAHSKQIDDDESVEAQRAAAAREAVLKKRIPKLIRNSKSDNTAASAPDLGTSATSTRSPLYDDRSNDNSDISAPARSKPQREKRLKPSKWGDKVDGAANAGGPGNPNHSKPWTKGGMMRPHPGGGFRGAPPPPTMPSMHPQMPWQMQLPPGIAPVPPFVNPGPMIRSSVPPPPLAPVLPIIPLPPNIPKPCNSIDNPQADLVRTITIDGLLKEIRIYDQVAIVFMELDQPREIGFQAGQRSIIIDDEPPIALQFNDDYKTFSINGQPHRLRFGFPSRELYIDEHWYEIYFGGPPVSIPIQNRIHILKAEGPPPQVNIGALRRDLVVGKINMIVDAHIVIPLFLDAKPQCFKLGNQDHTVQFADNLLTVLLDGEPAKVEYGGLPKSYVLGGVSYFIRFGALPQGLKAGQIVIKDMIYVKTEPPKPEPIEQITTAPKQEVIEPTAESVKTELDVKTESAKIEQDIDTAEVKPEAEVEAPENEKPAVEVIEPQVVGTAGSGNSAIPIFSATALNQINIDELFQKLVSSGILGGAGSVVAPSNKDAGVLPSAAALEEEAPQPVAIRPIDLSKSETVKTRQTAIVDTLFSGMQCSSCGVRFPPEQTIKYSQHLDWHFRQNRRERDLSRKAHSRKWYYDLADWVQYEEIEDLEEREKNFFESQQNDIEACDETSNQKWLNSPVPLSCPALPEDVDRACDMCQEKFEQFYHEETEEWHLRNATRVEDKIYHPLCYEDYKAALNAKAEEKDEKTNDKEADETNTDDDVIIKIEGDDQSDVEDKDANSTSIAVVEDDDDDVIVLPNEEPSVTEIDDDDEYVPESVPPQNAVNEPIDIDDEDNAEAADAGADAEAAGSDVEIQEPNIPFTDLDTYVEKEQPDADETSQLSFMNVKIKEEPKDDDDEDEDDGFEDVGTVLIPPDEEISIQSSEETQTQTITSSTSGMSPTTERPPSSQSLVQSDATEFAEGSATNVAAAPTDLNASIDGNTGTEDEHNLSTVGPSPAIPLASLVNKIKINIAKSSISANSSSTSNNNNNSNSGSASTAIASSHSMGGSPSKASTISDAHTGDNSDGSIGGENTASYSNVSAISVVSTIPVLCGGGTMGARTTTVIPVSSSSNTKNIAANEESNVSTISVIGSYGSTSSAPRYFPPTTSSTIVQNIAKRQQPTTTPPPPAQEEPLPHELKESLKNVKLTKTKKVQCGVETSGLCSVM